MTAAQARCWREISSDLMCAQPMQRLLQGDVGCGKTLLALLAAVHVAENGLQCAVLAPTEALAEQHYIQFCEFLSALYVPVVWLAGGLNAKQRREALALLATDAALVAVGTHALLEDSVVFARLGLAIVDEQHRFGVTQRAGLGHKGRHSHLLMLSATPIPRTLAMSQFGDLDVSLIDQLPAGRAPIGTHLVAQRRRSEVIERLAAACRAGAQAYWVCPLIEQSEAADLQAAQATWSELSEALPDLEIGLIHGRLEREQKRAALAAFAAAKLHVLVATTVVEVGIDVANATVIVIDHAQRYGLAQLHQLRGRVGRGAQPSSCILLYDAQLTDTARQRLRAMNEHRDGFALARIDLELRGPGEMLGMRQSGVPELRFTDLNTDIQILERAREVARRLWDEAPEIAARHLARWRGVPTP